MSTLSVLNPTLMDIALSLDPKGQIAPVIELLNQTNPILEDMPWIEGNTNTGNVATIRAGLPTVAFRKMYGFTQPGKSQKVKITDTCGQLMAFSEVDEELVKLSGNPAQFRLGEDMAYIEAMNQKMATSIFYGSEVVTPESFTGLGPRYNSSSAGNARNYLRSASSPDASDNTSIWLVGWGANTVHGIYPKGTTAGLSVKDLGVETVTDSNGGKMRAFLSQYTWNCGLTLKDWRYVVRIMIDQEDLTKGAATGPDLIDLMVQAVHRIPSLDACKPVFYCNRNVMEFIDRQTMNKTVMAFTNTEDAQGKFVTKFRGIPIRRSDAILNTETFVS